MNSSEVKSAARVLEILELLTRVGEPVSFGEIAAELRLPKSSAHALLRTLVGRGYAERDDAERYVLAAPFRNGGWIGGADSHLAAVARPVMEELRARLRETVFLGARGTGGDVKILAKLVSPEQIRYDNDRPGLRPAWCTAMGRVLLAYWDAKATAAYLAKLRPRAITPRTVTDPDRLRAIIDRVRHDGFAVVEDEFATGGSGAAAPIHDGTGRVVAALNLATVTRRFPGARKKIIDGVVHGAQRISQRLGHRPSLGSAA
ncbi:MAG: IclR family transcriptional regulator [Alphaproteobacteria bacterium]|nr:IclR family transcriptional regulator [Alphaproteobacteria bacterium]